MSEFVHTSSIRIPKDCSDPIGELEIFLRANGYVSVTEETSLRATRGEKGKGFWTSDLTVLPTTVNVEIKEEVAEVEYRVITTGQILSAIERQFWQREAGAAAAFLAGEPLENFKEAQRFQADEIRAGFVKKGITLSVATAFILFAVGFFFLK